jgi:hypothetical protein
VICYALVISIVKISGDAIDEKIQTFLFRKIETRPENQVEMGEVIPLKLGQVN